MIVSAGLFIVVRESIEGKSTDPRTEKGIELGGFVRYLPPEGGYFYNVLLVERLIA